MLLGAEMPVPESLRVGWERRHELWFDASTGVRLASLEPSS
jgi:hypothetical protein